MKKSDGVEDIFHWLEQKCKDQKKEVDDLVYTNRFGCHICYNDEEYSLAKERLDTLVEIKIGVEKYMKKLRHQGE